MNEVDETIIETINLTEIIQQEISRRGLVFGCIDIKLPETVEILCGKPHKPFIVTDEVLHRCYPYKVIYKPDLEIIKEKISSVFYGLDLEKQNLFKKFLEERLVPNEKQKKKKEMIGVSVKIWNEFDRNYRRLNKKALEVIREIRRVFAKEYEVSILNSNLKEIQDFNRKDFIILRKIFDNKKNLDDPNLKLPWEYLTSSENLNWTEIRKIDDFRYYFTNFYGS
jgi:hypothetical protein